MHRYLTELIGTFFLVLTIGLTVLGGSPMAPLAIGSALMVMVYMGGHVCGAHYNPAVTLGLWLRGSCGKPDLLPYFVAQVAGAVAASIVVYVVLGRTFVPAPAPTASIFAALLVEVLYTMALVLVVMNVATAQPGNGFFGLAIGFTVTVAAFAGGPISGGAYNPAVGLGPAIVHAVIGGGSISHVWLYVVGPCLGAVFAALIFKLQQASTPPKVVARV